MSESATFVNPYTFVPFPEVDGATFRRKPVGHDRLGGSETEPRYVGEIEVVLTARSPVLVRDRESHARDSESRFPRRAVAGRDEPVPYLPGSGLAGVFRSLHESIAGGCLRVFHGDFVPSYRDPVQPLSEDWRLARVVEVDADKRPRTLQLCTRYDHVQVELVARALGGTKNVVTGARIGVKQPDDLRTRRLTVQNEDQVFTGEGCSDSDDYDDCVVLLTDSKTRSSKRPYFCTVGRLSTSEDDLLSWETAAEFDDGWKKAWDSFLRQVEGTDDMRRARSKGESSLHPEKGPVEADVVFPPEADDQPVVGRRHQARPRLFPGQVLWVLPRKRGGVAAFSLAQVWRHAGGSRTAAERVQRLLKPCEDPEKLCPTCRVWGSADVSTGSSHADQRSYRGHLRFSDALPIGEPPTVHSRQLAPLGQPRPGAGQFYLEPTSHKPLDKENPPLREWGSRADRAKRRMLRGRKHYWLTDQHEQRPLFRVTSGSFDSEMAATAEYVAAGTRFAATVRFESLSLAELGGVLASLNPSLVLADARPGDVTGDVGLAVGGGRPLGFGTCSTEITKLAAHTASSWYSNASAPSVAVEEAVEEFRDQVARGVRTVWPALATALTMDRVPPERVWYPPAAPLPEGPLSTDDLEAGFEFWKQSASCPHKLVLPLVTEEPMRQALPIVSKEESV